MDSNYVLVVDYKTKNGNKLFSIGKKWNKWYKYFHFFDL